MRRLPRIIRLPGGFVIEIKKQILSHGRIGAWDYDINTGCGMIWVNPKADLPSQWRTIGHEMGHAAVDYAHWIERMVARPAEIEMGRTAAELRGDE